MITITLFYFIDIPSKVSKSMANKFFLKPGCAELVTSVFDVVVVGVGGSVVVEVVVGASVVVAAW